MTDEELDQWAYENGEPERVGAQARLFRYANGCEEEDDDDTN